MKKIKKIVSLLLAMAMMFAMTTTAFAEDAYKLTIRDMEQNRQSKSTSTLTQSIAF